MQIYVYSSSLIQHHHIPTPYKWVYHTTKLVTTSISTEQCRAKFTVNITNSRVCTKNSSGVNTPPQTVQRRACLYPRQRPPNRQKCPSINGNARPTMGGIPQCGFHVVNPHTVSVGFDLSNDKSICFQQSFYLVASSVLLCVVFLDNPTKSASIFYQVPVRPLEEAALALVRGEWCLGQADRPECINGVWASLHCICVQC